jgi:hypothetical protein
MHKKFHYENFNIAALVYAVASSASFLVLRGGKIHD